MAAHAQRARHRLVPEEKTTSGKQNDERRRGNPRLLRERITHRLADATEGAYRAGGDAHPLGGSPANRISRAGWLEHRPPIRERRQKASGAHSRAGQCEPPRVAAVARSRP